MWSRVRVASSLGVLAQVLVVAAMVMATGMSMGLAVYAEDVVSHVEIDLGGVAGTVAGP